MINNDNIIITLSFLDWLKLPFNKFKITILKTHMEILLGLGDNKIDSEIFGVLPEKEEDDKK